MENAMNIAENIKHLLNEKGWTPERLVVALQDVGTNVTPQTVSNWICGKCVPGGASIVALATAFDCTTDAILRGSLKESA